MPLNVNALKDIVDHSYKEVPDSFDFTAIAAAKADDDIAAMKGKLKLLSPEELVRAPIETCARDVRQGLS